METTNRIGLLIAFWIPVLVFAGCVKPGSASIIAEVGPEKISIADYERHLAKSNGSWEAAQKLPMEEKERYLDLLVKFRLKVLDAYHQGLDKDPEILQELKDYRTTLATSFLLDRVLVELGLRRMYQRRKEEIRASHILISLPTKPSSADTLKAWNKALDLLQRARAGEDFQSLAQQYSDDATTKGAGGDVYYFTSGVMAPAFEDACYEIKVGAVYPRPVRTGYGYHVIKVTDRKKSRGQIRASHIMVRFEASSPTPEDTLKAYNEIRALQDSILQGADFAALAKEHSQDITSAMQGGDLGFFERRRAVQPFDEAAFSLKVGEISGIVRTPYGYHLIKVTDEKPLGPFREVKQTLRQVYQNNRYTHDYNQFLGQYRSTVNFKFHNDAVDTLLSCVDSSARFENDGWAEKISPTLRQKPVLSFATEVMILDSVISTLKSDPEFSKMQATAENIQNALDRIAERRLLRHRVRNIEKEFPQFKAVLKEYQEGILLYKTEQQHIWSKLSAADSLLRDYFEHNRDRYTLPDRVNLSEIYYMRDSSYGIQFLDSLKAGVDFGELAARHTERIPLREKKGEWGLLPVKHNPITEIAGSMEVGAVGGPFHFEGGYCIIKVLAKDRARLKTYEEALPELSGHYHEYMSKRLEEDWLASVRKEFKVSVWKEKLKEAFLKPPPEE